MGFSLTANLFLEEFACPCCSKVSADYRLVMGLQELRAAVNKSIIIVSAFRCENQNITVGGTKNSVHMIGLAADIIVPEVAPIELLRLAEGSRWFNGFGLANRTIHVDARSYREYWYYNKGVSVPCTRDRLFRIADES